jgi:hypothetical protein
MKVPSFKEYVNSLKASPYNYLISNTEEFKKEEAENGIEEDKEKKDAENKQSLLQYLLYTNAANQK